MESFETPLEPRSDFSTLDDDWIHCASLCAVDSTAAPKRADVLEPQQNALGVRLGIVWQVGHPEHPGHSEMLPGHIRLWQDKHPDRFTAPLR